VGWLELYKHGARCAVLNTCRLAKGASVDFNIAISLLRSGVWGWVAISFNVVSRPVQTFTRIFYEALLHGSASFDFAASVARTALCSERNRTSRFGQMVEIDDSMGSIVYFHGRVPWTPTFNLRSPLKIPREDNFQPKIPYGREDDILKSESTLLMLGSPFC
jgi:hypothetical protein